MTTTLTLPKWYDLHVHFRQGDLIKPLIEQHLQMGCAGVVAMPNTIPPVAKVFEDEPGNDLSIQEYNKALLEAGGTAFKNIIIPLYLTASTTPHMIERGAKGGLLKSAKYYPPHATTNSNKGVDLSYYMDNGVLKALQDNGVILNVHGEIHGLKGEEFFGRETNAEVSFYREVAPRLVDKFPNLKIVTEHITSKAGVEFVQQAGPNVAASVTPQHLLYTIGDLLQGLKYHLYCMPLVKYEDDLEALRKAVTSPDNIKFFAGTDSAPHAVKITSCCGAAGCYTGGIAPQLYADAFEKAGIDLGGPSGQEAFKKFLCLNGPAFYGLVVSTETFILTKEPQEIGLVRTPSGTITPLPIGMQSTPATKTTLPWTVR